MGGTSTARARNRPPGAERAVRPASSTPGRLVGGLILVVALAVLCVYRPVLSAGATGLDDRCYLTDNPIVQEPGWRAAARAFREVTRPYVPGYYEPLAVVSLMLDYAQGGRVDYLRPFHRMSLALHIVNTALLIVLLHGLFRSPWAAALTGLLFGVHPLTVEPVALVAQRKVLLAAFFCLLSLVLYVRHARGRGPAFLTAAWVAYGLALLSKPTSTPLPVLMLLLDIWPLGRLGRRSLLEKVPFFVLAAASGIITILACKHTSGITLPGGSSLVQLGVTIAYLVGFYCSKMVWPAGLSSVYRLPVPSAITNPVVLAGVLAACVVSAAAVVSWRRTRSLLVGWLFFLVAVFPTMGAVGYTWLSAADKHVYLAGVGMLLLIAAGLARLWGERSSGDDVRVRRFGATAAMVIVCAALAVGSRSYLAEWQDSERLVRHMLKRAPDVALLHNELAVELSLKQQYPEAIAEYEEALRLSPTYAEARCNLGNTLFLKGDVGAAVGHYAEAIRLRPEYAEAHYRLGNALASQGDLAGAVRCYGEALRLRPAWAEAHYSLGSALADQNRLDDAIRHYEEAIRLRPSLVEAYNNLAIALAETGRLDEAIARWTEAVRRKPTFEDARNNLSQALMSRQQAAETPPRPGVATMPTGKLQ